MPFKSEAQRRWMHATHPAMAKRWERETPKGKHLPARLNSKQKKSAHGSGAFTKQELCDGYKRIA